jgi:hypothetical protein
MVPHSRSKHRRKTELFLVERDLNKLDFESSFKEDIIYHYGNEDWILDLRRHPKAAEKMPWLFRTHSSDIVRLVHNGLFRVPEVAQIIKVELKRQVNADKLVCFSGNEDDDYELQTFLDFNDKMMFNNKSKIYINGVSDLYSQLKASIPRLGQQLVKINIKSIYEQFSGIGERNKRLLHQLLNIQVFKVCDVLVLSENPSGILAAQLRRDESNLYCYRDGTIFPCLRSLISRSFRDVANKPEYIDSKHFCTLSPKDCDPK